MNMLTKLVSGVNRDKYHIDKKIKQKLLLLNDIQVNFNKVYIKLKDVLAKKKGDIRQAVSGRYSFSNRSVIRQDPSLKTNQIRLPFACLLEYLQQLIINILVKSFNISYADAYKKWRLCQFSGYDQTVYNIIDGIIKDHNGLPVLINVCPISW